MFSPAARIPRRMMGIEGIGNGLEGGHARSANEG
jgi:hypothetical protein